MMPDSQESYTDRTMNPHVHTLLQIYQFHHIYRICFVTSLFFSPEPFESKFQTLCPLTSTYVMQCVFPTTRDILLHYLSTMIKINIDLILLSN